METSRSICRKYSNYMVAKRTMDPPHSRRSAGTAGVGARILERVARQGARSTKGAGEGFAAAAPLAIKHNQLRYVLSAAEQGSFRRAAAALNLQQSTISRRVRELEDRLGAAIFERDATGVHPTPTGARFLSQARQAAERLAAAADVLGAAGRLEQGQLRVGVAAPLGAGFLGRLFAEALARRLTRDLVLVEAAPLAHRTALIARRLDVAFLPDSPMAEPDSLARRPLWREPLVAALPSGHRLATRSVVDWTDLAGERVMVADDGLRAAINETVPGADGAGPQTVGAGHTASLGSLLRLAALGQGVVVLAQSFADGLGGELVTRSIRGAAIGFSAVWSARNDKRVLRRLLGLAADLA
jgi:DNA-binding transcriptional LysR family regulator